jgi:uncharacterized protein YebE (UPF0316 family)
MPNKKRELIIESITFFLLNILVLSVLAISCILTIMACHWLYEQFGAVGSVIAMIVAVATALTGIFIRLERQRNCREAYAERLNTFLQEKALGKDEREQAGLDIIA